jgi:hypothetical protein
LTDSKEISHLYDFVKKRTATISGISNRKLYGLNALYLSDKPYIIISPEGRVVVKVEDFEVKKYLETQNITEWKWKSKTMENWFLLPESFNKKKNKLSPILDMTSKVLLNPKKAKRKIKNKKKIKKNSLHTNQSSETVKNSNTQPSLFKRILNLLGIPK